MRTNIDISGRYLSAFGHLAVVVGSRLRDKGLDTRQTVSGLPVYHHDQAEFFDEVTLARGSESYYFGLDGGDFGDTEDVFALPPMVWFRREKKLITTPLNNSDVEIVERYHTAPYTIDWQGVLIDSENHAFPNDKLRTLRKIFETNGIWDVSGEIFEVLGIESMYITDLYVSFVEGYPDTVAYNMRCVSTVSTNYDFINEE